MERRDPVTRGCFADSPINKNWLSALAPSQMYSELSKRGMRAGRDRAKGHTFKLAL
jgi:hypothetical protein